MKSYSPALMGALIGMSIFTHAMSVMAQTQDNVPPAEKGVRRSDVTCFQNGVAVIDEKDIHNLTFGDNMTYGQRADGSQIIIAPVDKSAGTLCRIVERDRDTAFLRE
jgi:hypothetical protein